MFLLVASPHKQIINVTNHSLQSFNNPRHCAQEVLRNRVDAEGKVIKVESPKQCYECCELTESFNKGICQKPILASSEHFGSTQHSQTLIGQYIFFSAKILIKSCKDHT